MSEAYDRIKQALDEALAFAEGHTGCAVIHRIEVPKVEAAAIRPNTAKPKLRSS